MVRLTYRCDDIADNVVFESFLGQSFGEPNLG